ncbi:MAG: hypothetical protein FRX48_03475 [Lasallia pustulata]|uniref:Uncharacterized protein n=1 Tax=Lasallia pustulata TaxID=136370 RepID=A0A5M8PSS8_9LECA|nr:MAG: hypothetical protein FRX48_03475 [Lasallia pustulata]
MPPTSQRAADTTNEPESRRAGDQADKQAKASLTSNKLPSQQANEPTSQQAMSHPASELIS